MSSVIDEVVDNEAHLGRRPLADAVLSAGVPSAGTGTFALPSIAPKFILMMLPSLNSWTKFSGVTIHCSGKRRHRPTFAGNPCSSMIDRDESESLALRRARLASEALEGHSTRRMH